MGCELLWSFTNLKEVLGLAALENAHIVAIVSLITLVIGNILTKQAKPGLFVKIKEPNLSKTAHV